MTRRRRKQRHVGLRCDGIELSDAECGACQAIADAPEAWLGWLELEGRFGPEALDSLVRREIVVPWFQPEDVAVTFSPWGAWALGVSITEEWRDGTEAREEFDLTKAAAPQSVKMERVQLETPVWEQTGGMARPMRIPRHARIGCTLIAPERVAAPEDDETFDLPQYLIDQVTEEPLRLFAGSLGGGWTVKVEQKRTR